MTRPAIISIIFMVLAASGVLRILHAAPCESCNVPTAGFPTQIPDLHWTPDPDPAPVRDGALVRYIDYDTGDDNNPGTRRSPWKHHPWDPLARGQAARGRGIVTYVFKRGVVYRGILKARESGNARTPIRLTSSSDWGSGEAVLSSSTLLKGNWRQCTGSESAILPRASRGQTFCLDTRDLGQPDHLWLAGDRIIPLHLARLPDWTAPAAPDPREKWLELDDSVQEITIHLSSTRGFKAGDQVHKVGDHRRPYFLLVDSVTSDGLRILARGWPRGGLPKGSLLSNGKATARVKDHTGTHKLIRRLYDSSIMRSEAAGNLQGATPWVERPPSA